MRVLYGIIVFFALFLLACSDAEREEKRLEGNLLMKGDSGVCYDGIGLTSLIWCCWLVGVIRSFKYSTKMICRTCMRLR